MPTLAEVLAAHNAFAYDEPMVAADALDDAYQFAATEHGVSIESAEADFKRLTDIDVVTSGQRATPVQHSVVARLAAHLEREGRLRADD